MTIKVYILPINPVAKPRMTARDKWRKRPIVNHYYAFKDMILLYANKQGLTGLPDSIYSVSFIIEMPKSWSEKKKKIMDRTPHKQTPDLDNLLKSLQDCLCTQDNHIYQIDNLVKRWGYEGQIIIKLNET